jgi:hypothetical protein
MSTTAIHKAVPAAPAENLPPAPIGIKIVGGILGGIVGLIVLALACCMGPILGIIGGFVALGAVQKTYVGFRDGYRRGRAGAQQPSNLEKFSRL